jgi:hypothetical protein
MPKRTDLQSILIPGSGPTVIGQAAEFDYGGTQAMTGAPVRRSSSKRKRYAVGPSCSRLREREGK